MEIYGHDIIIEHPPIVFGDGEHETTRSLLYALNKYGAKGKSYVDIGCGSGILSIFASKLGMTVIAIDCDKYATDCTEDNIRRNGAENIKVICDAVERVNDISAGIVTGNFPQALAIYFLPILSRFVKEGGLLMTTWYNKMDKLPTDELDWQIIEHIEGVEYDCYVLKKPKNKQNNMLFI